MVTENSWLFSNLTLFLKKMLICRICLFELGENDTFPVENIATILEFCTTIKVNPKDDLPRFVCKSCNDRAQIAFNFKILCEESDMYLKCHEILDISTNKTHKTSAENENLSQLKADNKGRFKCGSCDLIFFYKKRLISHEQRHKEGFTCKDCGKDYGSAKHLAVHISIEKRKGSHLCQVCGKEFTMPENLKRHQRIHEGVKRFTCQLCTKSFIQSNELKSHMISHTDQKEFLCNFCGQKYARPRSLKIHIMRLHKNDGQKHLCTLCGRAFKGLVDMRNHQVIHSDRRNHICKTCNKAFNKSSNLKAHERIHTGHRPFVCHICQKTFIQKHVLNKHLNTHPPL